MPQTSSANHTLTPPVVTIPRDYNAAHDLKTAEHEMGGRLRTVRPLEHA